MSEGNSAIENSNIYRPFLEQLFRSYKLNLPVLAKCGTLSCDVGRGTEIPTFAPYDPQVFVATEPEHNFYPTSLVINQSLHDLSSQFPKVRILRDSRVRILERLREEQMLFGLITWLNVYPTLIREDSLIEHVQIADSLLIHGGATMVSIDFPRDDTDPRGVDFICGLWPTLQDLGYTVHFSEQERSYGGLSIIGIKPE